MRPAKPLTTALAALFLAGALAGCVEDNGGPAEPVTVRTSMGCFVMAFFPDDAPRTVENFFSYVDDGFYDGTVFHRVMPGFVVQGGGFTPDGRQKDTDEPIPLEAGLPNVRGSVAMARTGDPNSATSQFFVNLVDNTGSLDPGGAAGPDGYAVFGEVTQGMDVIDAIADVRTATKNGMENWPADNVIIESIERGDDCTPTPPPEPTYGIDAGLIHNTNESGVWTVNVSANVDYAPMYVINTGNQDDTFRVEIQGPAHWEVAVEPAPIPLAENDGKRTGSSYGYARHAMALIHYNESLGEASDDDRVTISLISDGDPDAFVDLVLAPKLTSDYPTQVSSPGDTVTIGYRGYFDDGEVFDPGARPLEDMTVAGRGLVTGFSYGMAGLALDERLPIRFPPELGYGNDNAESSPYAQFNNEWLNFDLHMQKLPSEE